MTPNAAANDDVAADERAYSFQQQRFLLPSLLLSVSRSVRMLPGGD
jgi:hypothetical protein